MSRQEKVDHFLSNGHVWPCTVEMKPNHSFMKALKEVLLRLPEKVFCEIEHCVQFIIEEYKTFAFNVPFEQVLPEPENVENPQNVNKPSLHLDTIVVYERCLRLSHEAFVALLAHEIAHSVVKKRNHSENEDAADKIVISWGFGKELAKFHEEKKQSTPTAAGQ